jgi:two-component system, chemotaxis family, protein-glutamate methylesterase/glutaminase
MIRVLIVDDSALVRQVLSEVLSGAGDIDVIGAAADPIIARSRMEKDWPDVIITDIEMPRKNGLEFLEEVMKERPTPVIICSSYAGENASLSMRALAAGAVDIIEKPKVGVKDFLNESVTMLVDSVRSAAKANVKRLKAASISVEPKLSADVIIPNTTMNAGSGNADRIVVIGASAGGTHAIEYILTRLPENAPPIAIVQHMPENFTRAFAERLNSICRVSVKEGAEGDALRTGVVCIAPGGRHMALVLKDRHYQVAIKDGPLVSRHRPSVDVLFRSASKTAGRNALGIILTGMGDDGARGMVEMKEAGVHTIAQNEETCTVFGMPKEAIRLGAAQEVLPIDDIPDAIVRFAGGV